MKTKEKKHWHSSRTVKQQKRGCTNTYTNAAFETNKRVDFVNRDCTQNTETLFEFVIRTHFWTNSIPIAAVNNFNEIYLWVHEVFLIASIFITTKISFPSLQFEKNELEKAEETVTSSENAQREHMLYIYAFHQIKTLQNPPNAILVEWLRRSK